jgi:Transport and Golgi organisation 2
MHSRDELRSRSSELPTRWHELRGSRRANWPTDPDGGGTWVAVRDDGLYLGLLNLNLREDELDPDRPEVTKSRGVVIPQLIGCTDFKEVVVKLHELDLAGTSPFRLIMCGPVQDDGFEIAVARFDGMQLTMQKEVEALGDPECWASSGLGDELVQCRLPLFDEFVTDSDQGDLTMDSQRAFHFHQWEDRPELSVLMSREDARTSSVTVVEYEFGSEPKVLYEPIEVGDPILDPIGAGMLK